MDRLAVSGPLPRVLVVEDDPVSAMLVKRLLAAQNIEADLAPDGQVALQMHRDRPYRLVISDWMMPEMDGVQLCREFRQLKEQYVYFILCSAKGERADRLEAFEAGVDDVLSKPLDREELHARLNVATRILACEEDLQDQKAELEQSSRLLQDMNECLKLASRRFEELFNGLPVASFTFDEDGRIHEWNKAAQEVFGIPAYEAIQRPVWEVLNRRDNCVWDADRVSAVFAEGKESSFDWNFHGNNGEIRYLASNLICLRGRGGEAVGGVCANLDVTERKLAEKRAREFAERLEQQKLALEDANARLNHLAVTDGLTALWNHRRFQEMLDEALKSLRTREIRSPWSCWISTTSKSLTTSTVTKWETRFWWEWRTPCRPQLGLTNCPLGMAAKSLRSSCSVAAKSMRSRRRRDLERRSCAGFGTERASPAVWGSPPHWDRTSAQKRLSARPMRRSTPPSKEAETGRLTSIRWRKKRWLKVRSVPICRKCEHRSGSS